jgi:hypothetical protein
MKMVRKTYAPNNPPKFSNEQRARLKAMTDAEIVAAAESDPDNRPMAEERAKLAQMGHGSPAASGAEE